MMLSIFLILIGLSIFLISLGYFSKETAYSIIGFIFLFFISIFIILPGDVCYNYGYNETYMYGNNFTGYHWDYDTGTAPDGPQVDAYLFHHWRVNEITCFDDSNSKFFGIWLSIISLIGFIIQLFEIKSFRGGDD